VRLLDPNLAFCLHAGKHVRQATEGHIPQAVCHVKLACAAAAAAAAAAAGAGMCESGAVASPTVTALSAPARATPMAAVPAGRQGAARASLLTAPTTTIRSTRMKVGGCVGGFGRVCGWMGSCIGSSSSNNVDGVGIAGYACSHCQRLHLCGCSS
jgi:hypothetical protein